MTEINGRILSEPKEQLCNENYEDPVRGHACGLGAWPTPRARQTTPAQTPPPAMPAPPDVKIETINVAPGIYMLMGRGGNIGLTVGTDGAAIIDDQFADMAPKIRAAVAMLRTSP